MTRKSIHFGSDNLVFVPESQPLSVYDLYNWNVLELDTHAVRLRLRSKDLPQVLDTSRQFLKEYLETPDGQINRDALQGHLDSLLRSLADAASTPEPSESAPQAADRLLPSASLSLWARLGDQPLESYFEEDYEPEPPLSDPAPLAIPVYGSVALTRLGEREITLPESGPGAAFLLEFPSREALRSVPIDPRRPLPVVREFCGAGGSSNRGAAVNYTLAGKLAPEKLGCVPLHRLGPSGFATLYLHLKTPIRHDVLVRIRGQRIPLAQKKIASLGYSLLTEGPTCRIWERHAQGDILHLYFDIPGKESEFAPYVPPFVLAAQASGGFDPQARSRLIAELLQPGTPAPS
jgi:hypothetical protein